MNPRILLVDDDRCFAETIRLVVRPLGARVVWAESARQGFQQYTQSEAPFDLVVIDYHLPDLKGAELAEILKRRNKNQQIAFATGDSTKDTLTALLKTGSAVSFISKGDKPAEMLQEIEKGIDAYRRGKRVLTQPESPADLSEMERALAAEGIVGRSKAMHDVLRKIHIFRGVNVDVLILGESGVGKELVAKPIARPGEKIYPVNCAAFSESSALLESELFGHAKGAFTDAKSDKPGIVEVAEGGIVLLDEIHTLSAAAQAKLLRFLQEKKFRRVGEAFERSLVEKIRVICTAKPSLPQMADEGKFLPDLFYRIAKAQIHVPPLRARLDDLEPLVLHFSAIHGKRFNKRCLFESSVLKEMEKCQWPGNVRELENTVSSLILGAEQELICGEDFLKLLGEKVSAPATTDLPLQLAKKAFERQQILTALKSSRSVTEAAQKLNIARTTLSSRLSRMGIEAETHFATAN